jgi:hypothetical protein
MNDKAGRATTRIELGRASGENTGLDAQTDARNNLAKARKPDAGWF